MPLQTVEALASKPSLLAQVDKMCDTWKGSQKPLATWPSVVVENCNRAGTAKMRIMQKAEQAKLRKQMGI